MDGDFRRFVNARAAGRQGRHDLHHDLIDRPVPWRDHPDNANRLATYDGPIALGMFEEIVA